MSKEMYDLKQSEAGNTNEEFFYPCLDKPIWQALVVPSGFNTWTGVICLVILTNSHKKTNLFRFYWKQFFYINPFSGWTYRRINVFERSHGTLTCKMSEKREHPLILSRSAQCLQAPSLQLMSVKIQTRNKKCSINVNISN